MPIVSQNRIARSPTVLGLLGVAIGLLGGVLVLYEPKYFFAGAIAMIAFGSFFAFSEQTIITMLILRSGLDAFSAQGLPAVFAVGLDGLVIAYVLIRCATRQTVQIDRFWWLFAGWIAIHLLWPVLAAIGGLSTGSAFLADNIRDWVRIFSWLMVYLMVNQLKDRLRPEQIINSLLLALAIPLSAAALQLVVPLSLLPSFLQPISASVFEAGSRVNGTLGHPSTFATFLILFVALTYWKIGESRRSLPWLVLIGVEIFFLVSTKSLAGLTMLGALIFVLTIPQLSLNRLAGAIVALAVLMVFFASSEFGRERIASIFDTPLLNANMTVNRAVLLSWFDGNSFNWRLAQWHFLVEEWRGSPLLGYGMGTAPFLGPIRSYAHNDYVRALVEGGLVGLVLFLAFQLAQLVQLVRLWSASQNPSKKRFCLGLIAVLMAMWVGMLTENVWNHTTLFFYWWTLFAIATGDWERPDSALDLSVQKAEKAHLYGN